MTASVIAVLFVLFIFLLRAGNTISLFRIYLLVCCCVRILFMCGEHADRIALLARFDVCFLVLLCAQNYEQKSSVNYLQELR